MSEINLPELISKIEAIIKAHNAEFSQEPARHGKHYTVRTNDARMEMIINESWIGYEISVKEKNIGNFEDTDTIH